MGVLVNVMIEVAMMVKVSCHEGVGVPVGLNGGMLAARNGHCSRAKMKERQG